jgi:2-polyprenyl-6-methoxyphenol hydroxylase-like FAD-dependent oxidoreductase
VLDQRGIADRFLAEGQVAQVAGFATTRLDISDFPTRHPYGLGLWQKHIERILAGWVRELKVPVHYGTDVTGFAQDDTGVDVALSDGRRLRAQYLVGCDGGRSLVRKAAGIDLSGWDPTTSALLAEVEMAEEPELGTRRTPSGMHALGKVEYEIKDGEVRDLGYHERRHEQRSCGAAEQVDTALVVAVAASSGRVEWPGVDDEHQLPEVRFRRTARATCSSSGRGARTA